MSAHVIYYGKDKTKQMRPIGSRKEYISLRNSAWQQRLVRGATTVSRSVGMDIDHIAADAMTAMKECILAKKDELGLLMLELSARGAGYHLVFKRRPELTQEENLKWASDLLGVAYDEAAKDITRVFYTTTASEEDLLFLDDGLFDATALQCYSSEEKDDVRGKR